MRTFIVRLVLAVAIVFAGLAVLGAIGGVGAPEVIVIGVLVLTALFVRKHTAAVRVTITVIAVVLIVVALSQNGKSTVHNSPVPVIGSDRSQTSVIIHRHPSARP